MCVWTLKYQKSGLPNIQLLLSYHLGDRYLDMDWINQIIYVDFPDLNIGIDNSLKDIVISQRVHDLCRLRFLKASCMTKSD